MHLPLNRCLAVLVLATCLPARMVPAAENSPAPDSSRHPPAGSANQAGLQELAEGAEHELRNNILPFWLKHTRDRERGGFYGLITDDMKVVKDAPRGALLTSRILWTFSAAYRTYRDPEYLAMARWAYRDLVEKFADKKFGGLYWTITADGQPLDTHKQIYGQVFGIYALAEYYRATKEQPALDQAIAIYRVVEQHAHDRKYGGYLDAFDQKWVQLDDRSNVLGRAPKSQNSHIHILEAYTNLLRAWPDEGLRQNQRELIGATLDHLIDPKTHHLILFLREDWKPVSDEISYGHDIELSWLLTEAADVLGDPALIARVRTVAVAIAQATLAEGVDADGGVFNEGNPHGLTNTNKDWWPQAEAAVGFLNAYQLAPQDPRYFTAARRSWNFIEAKLVDRKNGDWFESVTREGQVRSRAKVSLWKCPYHNSRSCLEVIERVHELTGVAPAAH